jgi:ribonuclease P/MRP protein subunit POP5
VWYAAQNLYGDAGSAAVDLTVVRFAHDGARGAAAVRARRGEVERARAAVACVDAVDGQPVGVRVRGVSGTVRACEERYLQGATGGSEERSVVFEDAARRAFVREADADVETSAGFVGATELDFPD